MSIGKAEWTKTRPSLRRTSGQSTLCFWIRNVKAELPWVYSDRRKVGYLTPSTPSSPSTLLRQYLLLLRIERR